MINPEDHCYTSDPSCPQISYRRNTTNTVYGNSDTGKSIEQFNLVFGIVLAATFVFLLGGIPFCFRLKKTVINHV